MEETVKFDFFKQLKILIYSNLRKRGGELFQLTHNKNCNSFIVNQSLTISHSVNYNDLWTAKLDREKAD